MQKAIIIGAGVGGLATAIRLARMGYSVQVFEAADKPGGKLAEIRGAGFRFDAGPSLFTLPELVLELLDSDLQFKVHRLPVITRYFWRDGMQFDASADPAQLCKEAERVTGVPASRVERYLQDTAGVYHITAPVFIFRSLHRLRSLFRSSNLPALFGLHRLKAFTSLHRHHEKAIGNRYLVQLFDRYATYNGSDPYQTPATLRVIAHLEHNLGAWLPEGGMYSIVEALFRQAERLGVVFHFNTPVLKVEKERNRVVGVTTGEGFHKAAVVVSNIDIYRFYSKLMPDARKLRKIGQQQMSSSAIIFYWGIRGNFPQLDVHNIFFSDDYRKEFEHLFGHYTLADDPTVYLYISSKNSPEDAPEGCENWFAMVNAPENKGQLWPDMVAQARSRILARLAESLGDDIESRIVFETHLDPVSIEARTGSWHGSLYGPSSNSRLSAFQRHPNFSRKVKGLYFTGGSVHPGGGIPLCIASAKIVAELVNNPPTGGRGQGATEKAELKRP